MLRRSHVSASGERRRRESQPSFGREKSRPHARQDRQASSVSRPLEGRQRRKSPVRRCFKSRPPFGGVRRFASGCRSFLRAVDWPLVQIPADRHTTTGTCVLGDSVICANRRRTQAIFCPRRRFFRLVIKRLQTCRGGRRRRAGAPARGAASSGCRVSASPADDGIDRLGQAYRSRLGRLRPDGRQ